MTTWRLEPAASDPGGSASWSSAGAFDLCLTPLVLQCRLGLENSSISFVAPVQVRGLGRNIASPGPSVHPIPREEVWTEPPQTWHKCPAGLERDSL